MIKLNKKKVAVIIIIIIVLVFSIFRKGKNKVEDKYYNFVTVIRNKDMGKIESTGRIKASEIKSVFIDKALKVSKVLVQEGDYVEKDQLLVTFDPSIKNKIERRLEQEEIELNSLKRDLNIEEQIFKLGGTSSNKIATLKENIKKSELLIEDTREEILKTASEIKSPVNGTITHLKAQENYLVDTREPLLEIADLTDLKIVLDIPEYNINNIKLDQEVILKPEIFEGKREFKGKVSKISKLSYTSKSTGENIVEVEVISKEEIPLITPGFKVQATVNISSDEDSLKIAKTAILFDNGQYFVFKVIDEKAVKTYIEVENIPGLSSLIKSGLSENDIVIANPNIDIKDGSPVNGIEKELENVSNISE